MENTTEWAMPDQRSLENPSTPLSDPDDWLTDALGGRRSPSGVVVNDETILTYSPVVRGVTLIANGVAKLATEVLKRQDSGKEPDKQHFAWNMLRHQANSEMTAFVFKQTMQAQAVLRGNSYAFIERNGGGQAIEMIPLPARKVWPVRANGVKFFLFQTDTDLRKLEAINVFHLRGMGLDSLLGLDTVNKSSESVGLGLAMQKYSSFFFGNAAEPRIAIEMEGKPDPETEKRLRENWASIHQGLSNSHKVALLTGGMKVNTFSAGAKESQLIESRQFSLVDVANWLNLPVHKVGGEGRTAFASLEQENRSFIEDTISPWLATWEAEYREKVLTEEEKENDSHVIKFKRVMILEADVATVSQVIIQEVNNGLLTQNEGRAIQDRPPTADGDKFRMPANIVFAGEEEETDPEPDDDTDDNDDDRSTRLAELTSQTLSDATGRMARRLGLHARKAAKDQVHFDDWLETVEAQHRSVVVETIETAAEAVYTALGGQDCAGRFKRVAAINAAVDTVFAGLRERLDECMATAERSEFDEAVDRAMIEYETEAAAVAVRTVMSHAKGSDECGTEQASGTGATNAAESAP